MRSWILRALVALLVLLPANGSGTARPAPRMVFPVVRSGWYSVINFRDDWHAPRMRRTADGWELIGLHEGNDVFAEPGTPVVAVLGGRVEQLGWTFYSGWRVGVRGTDGRYWFYAHLSRFAPGLAIGSPVTAGQLLGEVGNTGYGITPGHRDEFTYHLHLGIQEPDGTWVNPYPLVARLYDAAVRRGAP
ncbi:MAG: M23 family metallopeptidase [Actinomycetota bacterium]|nr:M23 family metallopeptidase [Actinomycetota bacterium]